jgi:hypothetical protein
VVSLPVHIDREKLDALADVIFTDDDIHDLVDLTSTYAGRFQGDQHMPIWMAIDGIKKLPSASEFIARRAYVEAVFHIWRDRKRTRSYGTAYRPYQEIHDGPAIQLLQYLLRALEYFRRPARRRSIMT